MTLYLMTLPSASEARSDAPRWRKVRAKRRRNPSKQLWYAYTADGGIHRGRVGGGVGEQIAFRAAVTLNRGFYPQRRRDLDSADPRPVLGIRGPVVSAGRTWRLKRSLADAPLVSVAVILMPIVPTSSAVGMPLNVRVEALKRSQGGSSSPSMSRAE